MFLNWKNEYSESEYTAQSSLQIQCNPYQATNGIFHRTRTKKIHNLYGNKKTLTSQIYLEKEEWNWKNQPA